MTANRGLGTSDSRGVRQPGDHKEPGWEPSEQVLHSHNPLGWTLPRRTWAPLNRSASRRCGAGRLRCGTKDCQRFVPGGTCSACGPVAPESSITEAWSPDSFSQPACVPLSERDASCDSGDVAAPTSEDGACAGPRACLDRSRSGAGRSRSAPAVAHRVGPSPHARAARRRPQDRSARGGAPIRCRGAAALQGISRSRPQHLDAERAVVAAHDRGPLRLRVVLCGQRASVRGARRRSRRTSASHQQPRHARAARRRAEPRGRPLHACARDSARRGKRSRSRQLIEQPRIRLFHGSRGLSEEPDAAFGVARDSPATRRQFGDRALTQQHRHRVRAPSRVRQGARLFRARAGLAAKVRQRSARGVDAEQHRRHLSRQRRPRRARSTISAKRWPSASG